MKRSTAQKRNGRNRVVSQPRRMTRDIAEKSRFQRSDLLRFVR